VKYSVSVNTKFVYTKHAQRVACLKFIKFAKAGMVYHHTAYISSVLHSNIIYRDMHCMHRTADVASMTSVSLSVKLLTRVK